ncbi:MAG TPA: hypothetical protein VJ043_01475 [Candidatus Paceibacterota bacterium]|nr:hypothetical protein [Candidatus Paceibacterota bacterium]
MDNTKVAVVAVVGLILGLAGGYYIGYDRGWEGAVTAAKAEADRISQETANPFAEIKTNPLEDVKTNPYENVKTNPFQ